MILYYPDGLTCLVVVHHSFAVLTSLYTISFGKYLILCARLVAGTFKLSLRLLFLCNFLNYDFSFLNVKTNDQELAVPDYIA